MRKTDYVSLIADIRRLRPIVVILLSIPVMLPTLDEMVAQGLSAVSVLLRLVETLVFIGVVVWLTSGVVLHYARVQIRSSQGREHEEDR